MAWLLDTNTWIRHLKQPGGSVEHRLNTIRPDEILLCSIVKAVLWHGALKYGKPETRQAALDLLFRPFVLLPFDDTAARRYASLRHDLEMRGMTIGPNDLKFAAIASVHGAILVSSNKSEFSRIPGLRLEDWAST